MQLLQNIILKPMHTPCGRILKKKEKKKYDFKYILIEKHENLLK